MPREFFYSASGRRLQGLKLFLKLKIAFHFFIQLCIHGVLFLSKLAKPHIIGGSLKDFCTKSVCFFGELIYFIFKTVKFPLLFI